ncbi:MAG: hypothetical protein M3P18_26195, partial [Actinomycetota bacterium]|nr:hypothetical protein [Actinomycetota bacterium]
MGILESNRPSMSSVLKHPMPANGKLVFQCPVNNHAHDSEHSACGTFPRDDGTEGWKCLKCNAGGDVFDLIDALEGDDPGTAFKAFKAAPAPADADYDMEQHFLLEQEPLTVEEYRAAKFPTFSAD